MKARTHLFYGIVIAVLVVVVILQFVMFVYMDARFQLAGSGGEHIETIGGWNPSGFIEKDEMIDRLYSIEEPQVRDHFELIIRQLLKEDIDREEEDIDKTLGMVFDEKTAGDQQDALSLMVKINQLKSWNQSKFYLKKLKESGEDTASSYTHRFLASLNPKIPGDTEQLIKFIRYRKTIDSEKKKFQVNVAFAHLKSPKMLELFYRAYRQSNDPEERQLVRENLRWMINGGAFFLPKTTVPYPVFEQYLFLAKSLSGAPWKY